MRERWLLFSGVRRNESTSVTFVREYAVRVVGEGRVTTTAAVSGRLSGDKVTGRVYVGEIFTLATVVVLPGFIPAVTSPARKAPRGGVPATTALGFARRGLMVATTLHSCGMGTPGEGG